MSQHIFRISDRLDAEITITIGFDRPLGYVFCTVFSNRRAAPIYTNLNDDSAATHLQDVHYYRGVLKRLGLEIPEVIFSEVESDQKNRVGNRVVDHTR